MKKCPNCGQDFGNNTYPLHVSTATITRSNRVLGVQDVYENKILWDLDYDTEDQYESEFIEEYFECSYCKMKITEDEVMTIIKYIGGKG